MCCTTTTCDWKTLTKDMAPIATLHQSPALQHPEGRRLYGRVRLATRPGRYLGKDGRRYSVEVVYYSDDDTQRLVILKEEAKKAGIELRLLKLDPSAAFKKIIEKRHDVAWMGWSTGLRPHFWEFWDSVNAHKGQTNNVTNTDDPEMDRLIEAYRNSLEENERIDLAHHIELKIHELGVFVPTFMVPYFREVYWRWWRFPDPPATRTSDTFFDPFSDPTGGLFWFDRTYKADPLGHVRRPHLCAGDH